MAKLCFMWHTRMALVVTNGGRFSSYPKPWLMMRFTAPWNTNSKGQFLGQSGPSISTGTREPGKKLPAAAAERSGF